MYFLPGYKLSKKRAAKINDILELISRDAYLEL